MRDQIFLPKYSSSWSALLVFFFLFGYPKIPFIGVPMAIFVLLFDWRNFANLCKSRIGRHQIISCFIFFFFCTFRILFSEHFFLVKNFLFSVTLCYKAIIGMYSAHVFIYLLKYKCHLISYMIFQILLMLGSAFNESIFQFLLLFQTAEAVSVFSEIFGVRSLGFGLIHTEGVTSLILMYILYQEFSKKESNFSIGAVGVMLYACAFSSRFVLSILPIWQIFKAKKTFFFALISLACVANYVDIDDGIWAQVFEFLNYYEKYGSLGSGSTDAIMEMQYFPDSLHAWFIGDGQFFSENGFYKETDIGLSRVMFFGGLLGLFSYINLCWWPLLNMEKSFWKMNYFLLFFLMYFYLVSNIKGIAVQSFSFIVFFHFWKLRHCTKSTVT